MDFLPKLEVKLSTEITLQELVEKVKADLFSSVHGTEMAGKIVYPIFLVDQVELEVNVEIINTANAGIKILIPQLFEGSVSGEKEFSKGHLMRIVLKPILTVEEMRTRIRKDKRLFDGVEQASYSSLYKGISLPDNET